MLMRMSVLRWSILAAVTVGLACSGCGGARAGLTDRYVRRGYVLREEARITSGPYKDLVVVVLSPKMRQGDDNYLRRFKLIAREIGREREVGITKDVLYFEDGGTLEIEADFDGAHWVLRFPHRLSVAHQVPTLKTDDGRVFTLKAIIAHDSLGNRL
jgi:hypothetical protein